MLQDFEIRLASKEDTRVIFELYKPYILNTVTTFEISVPEYSELSSRIHSVLKMLPWLVCYYNNSFAGYAYATEHRSREAYQWTKEVSVYVHEKFRKKKIATALYTVLLDILRFQGICNCLAGIALPNPASVRFHEKMGFEQLGTYHKTGFKFGSFIDVGWWEKFIQPEDFKPGNIISIKDVQHSREYNDAIDRGLKIISRF
jgi:phosphinothricin acetyltransferase